MIISRSAPIRMRNVQDKSSIKVKVKVSPTTGRRDGPRGSG